MAKCEVIDLTLSDNDTDGDFIQAKIAIHSFCINFLCSYYIKFLYIKFLLYQVRTTTEIISQDSCMYVVIYCSLAKSGKLICIGRSWDFRFAMITSVREKRFTGSSGKTFLDLSKCFQG